MSVHRVGLERQTWRNVAPFEACTLTRAKCSCGWIGAWCAYTSNAAAEGGKHVERVHPKRERFART